VATIPPFEGQIKDSEYEIAGFSAGYEETTPSARPIPSGLDVFPAGGRAKTARQHLTASNGLRVTSLTHFAEGGRVGNHGNGEGRSDVATRLSLKNQEDDDQMVRKAVASGVVAFGMLAATAGFTSISAFGLEPVKSSSPVGPGVEWTTIQCKHPGFREPVCYQVHHAKHPGMRKGGVKPVKCTTRDCQAPPQVSQSIPLWVQRATAARR
jgi:hypothetical protein